MILGSSTYPTFQKVYGQPSVAQPVTPAAAGNDPANVPALPPSTNPWGALAQSTVAAGQGGAAQPGIPTAAPPQAPPVAEWTYKGK